MLLLDLVLGDLCMYHLPELFVDNHDLAGHLLLQDVHLHIDLTEHIRHLLLLLLDQSCVDRLLLQHVVHVTIELLREFILGLLDVCLQHLHVVVVLGTQS